MDESTTTFPKKKRSERRQRKSLLHCRVLPEERTKIMDRASELGISASQFLRDSALGSRRRPLRKRLPTFAEKRLAQVLGQLGRVGSNLNQLTHLSHLEGHVADGLRLSATLVELRAVMSSLIEVIE